MLDLRKRVGGTLEIVDGPVVGEADGLALDDETGWDEAPRNYFFNKMKAVMAR